MHIRSSFSITTILLSFTILSPSLPPATTPSCRNYLETLLDLPWSHSTDDRLDVGRAKGDLDADHYGLEKVKKRVLEFLAVRQLKNTLKGRRSSIPPSLTPLPHPSPSSISPSLPHSFPPSPPSSLPPFSHCLFFPFLYFSSSFDTRSNPLFRGCPRSWQDQRGKVCG